MRRAFITSEFLAAFAFANAVGWGCGGAPVENADPGDKPPGDEMEESDPTETFTAVLLGSESFPDPVTTNATGTARFELSQDGQQLAFELTVSDIEDAFAAHIHLGARGEAGEIAVFLYVGDAVTLTGVLAQGTISDTEVVSSAASSLAELLELIRSGGTYVNVHTNAYPNGEIRGQIVAGDGS